MPEDMGPDFVGPSQPPPKLAWAREAEGKTIRLIELGATSSPLVHTGYTHESEAMVLHFTDGTRLLIQPGPNIWNMSDELEAAHIDPSQIRTNIIVHWLGDT